MVCEREPAACPRRFDLERVFRWVPVQFRQVLELEVQRRVCTAWGA